MQDSSTAGKQAQVADYWSRNVAGSDPFGPQVYWLAIPAVMARFQRRACAGRAYSSWYQYLVGEFLAPHGLPVQNILSLGCGTGALERALRQLGAFAHCDAYDIAPGAIDIARRDAGGGVAGAPDIRYEVRDIQETWLPSARYDAVWFNGSLHHIERLEYVLESVRGSLRPGAFLFFNEYIGARHFNFPSYQRDAISAAFSLLPLRYRRSFAPGNYGAELLTAPLPDWQEVRAADPSEAVRSDEILRVVGEYFDIVQLNPCGGSILQFLLCGLAGNFTAEDPQSMRYLDIIMAYEDLLMDSGDLPSDFVVVAAKPRC